MYQKTFLFTCVAASIFLAGCDHTNNAAPLKTQMQIREFQTRNYPGTDEKSAIKAVVHALQDEGFIVRNAVVDIGLVTASKEADVENKTAAVFQTLFAGHHGRWDKNQLIEASGNITSQGGKIFVRMNFTNKVLNNAGGVVEVKQIDTADFYQNFFSKVDKSLFIEGQKI